MRRIATRACDLVVVLLLLAAVLKLVEINRFLQAIEQWHIIPAWGTPAVAVGVPVLGLWLSGLWFVGGRQRWVGMSAASMIAVFTLAHVAEAVASGYTVPRCGCFGGADFSFDTLGLVFARNTAIMSTLLLGVWSSEAPSSERRPATTRRTPPRVHGLSLIETILVVALVGLLAALMLPTLALLRTVGLQSVSAANLRTHATVMQAYSLDHREFWPYLTDPSASRTVLRSRLAQIAVPARYFDLSTFWPVALLDGYYDGQSRMAVFQQPYSPKARIELGARMHTNYLYPCTFITAPEFWNRQTRLSPALPQLVGTQIGSVTWPALKSLIVGQYGPEHDSVRGTRELALVDGHVVRRLRSGLAREFFGAEGPEAWPELSDHVGSATPPATHTPDGLRGRDLITPAG